MAAYTKNTPGEPRDGFYAIGDVITDSVGVEWHCIQAGPVYPWRGTYFVPKYREPATPTPSTDATAGNATITAAQVLSGILVRDCAGASRTDTLPTAALLVAALTNPQVGQVIDFKVVNGSDPITEVLTVGAGAGGAYDTNQTAVAQIVGGGASKDIKIRLTDVGSGTEAYVVYA